MVRESGWDVVVWWWGGGSLLDRDSAARRAVDSEMADWRIWFAAAAAAVSASSSCLAFVFDGLVFGEMVCQVVDCFLRKSALGWWWVGASVSSSSSSSSSAEVFGLLCLDL